MDYLRFIKIITFGSSANSVVRHVGGSVADGHPSYLLPLAAAETVSRILNKPSMSSNRICTRTSWRSKDTKKLSGEDRDTHSYERWFSSAHPLAQ